jgi:hypothetical protein
MKIAAFQGFAGILRSLESMPRGVVALAYYEQTQISPLF